MGAFYNISGGRSYSMFSCFNVIKVKKAQAERDDATWEIERLVQDKVCAADKTRKRADHLFPQKNISRSFETQVNLIPWSLHSMTDGRRRSGS